MRPVGAQSVSPMGREAPCPWPLGPQRTEWLRARTSEDTAGRRINIDPDYTAVLTNFVARSIVETKATFSSPQPQNCSFSSWLRDSPTGTSTGTGSCSSSEPG